MKPVIKVNYTGMAVMARELARYSPQPLERIFRLETASVIKICAIRAQVASLAAIKRAVAAQAAGNFVSPDQSLVSINQQKAAGRVWFVPGDKSPQRGPGGTFLLVYGTGGSKGHHLTDFAWQAYLLATNDRVGYMKARVAELASRRGLQRLSWLQIGDRLGVPLASVAPARSLREDVARSARGPRGRTYQNGTAEIRITPRSLIIAVRNQSPLAIKNQGQGELDRAVAQRLRGFDIAVRHGVHLDLVARSRRWPGIFVTVV